MPRGSGIYEDEPREHRHAYSSDSTDGRSADGREGADPTPDDSASKDSTEPTG